jgi:hypothetical protein
VEWLKVKALSSDPILKKPITKKGLVKWFKVLALSSSPNTAKKNKKLYFVRAENTFL